MLTLTSVSTSLDVSVSSLSSMASRMASTCVNVSSTPSRLNAAPMYISRTAVRMLSGCSTGAGSYPDIGCGGRLSDAHGPEGGGGGVSNGPDVGSLTGPPAVVWPHQTIPEGTR